MTNLEIIVNTAYELNLVSEEEAMNILETENCPFHSFHEWKRLGYSVKKGSKALFKCVLWNREKELDKNSNQEVETFKKRWTYIFGKDQVEKTEIAKQKLAEQKEEKKEVKEERRIFRKTKDGKAVLVSANAEEKLAPKKTSKKSAKKTAQPKAESKAKTVKAKTVSQPKAEVKTVKATQPKAEVKKAGKKLAKAPTAKMTSFIRNGEEIIRIDMTNEVGNPGFLEMTRSYYMGLSKTVRNQIEKKWGLA